VKKGTKHHDVDASNLQRVNYLKRIFKNFCQVELTEGSRPTSHPPRVDKKRFLAYVFEEHKTSTTEKKLFFAKNLPETAGP
jgi:hypothetical protein